MKLVEVTPEDSIVPVFVEQLTELEAQKRADDLAAQQAAYEASKMAEEARAAARAAALAKIAEVTGLTEEEIAAL